MKILLNVLIALTVWHPSVSCFEAKNSSITFLYGFKCYFGHQRLREKSVVFLQYDGAPILCDEISFLAAQGDRNQLCLTPEYHHDPYCQIFIEYKSYMTGDILKTVKCFDNHTLTWCSEEEGAINVKIQMTSLVRQWTMARVKIKLESRPKTTIADADPISVLRNAFLWSAIILVSTLILLAAIVSLLIKRTRCQCGAWIKNSRTEDAALRNYDHPPSYHEATHPRSLQNMMPPKYSDIFQSATPA
uniref:Uncharacterized protein LOC111106030 n=1 Tax=Crassostrea virginica TaxID=6565 RepID=A0A8B8AZR1_CRAVI|nr:uncharacterized protein LOC111106030 [Crassostrea virginica]XP_022296253.1 uncharacterized protein LOC111106030 [Crassostrea virginica]